MSVKRRKGNRRGFAGDDVTDNQDYIEEVVPEEDDSYVVEGTDSPEGIKKESTIITDDHDVVSEEDYGTEEEFLAESEEGDAEVIDEDGESREGSRRGRKGIRRGSRRGESDGDELEEDLEELEEDTEELKEDREGRRRGSRKGLNAIQIAEQAEDVHYFPNQKDLKVWIGNNWYEVSPGDYGYEDLKKLADRNGSRKGLHRRGDAVEVIMDEDGNTEEVDLPEPDEREGRRKGVRRGSRKGSVYGGRSPEHQESIRSAVSIAMKDRRL